ncbi:MAG: fibronectin type III domain-containing protein, partial [Actinobacteria bacterium]
MTTIAGIPAGWVNTDVTATLSATDDMSGVDKTFSVTGSAAQVEYAGGITITSEGVTTIGYWSVDKAGNVETRNDAQVRVDKTAPSVPGVPAYSSLTTNTVVLTWDASTDALSGVARYELYDGTMLVASGPDCRATLAVEPGSQHSYTVRAVDVAGNASAFSAIGVVDVPIDGGGATVETGVSVTTTIGVPVYYENPDRDHHQNGDKDAVMETATVTIENVTKPGTLTVVWSENPPKKAQPEFMFANEYYDVSFTGTYDGRIIVTLPYDPRWPDAMALNFQLKHFANGKWEDVPVTVDLVHHTVTGVVTSLSPFAHAFPAGTDLST